jgi:hypothetical protein
LSLKFLAAAAVVVALAGIEATWSQGAIDATQSRVLCARVASPLGSNSLPGTTGRPFATVEKLVSSLQPGQAGCLRGGLYEQNLKITRGGTPGAPITITSFPGERATLLGRVYVADEANHVVIQQLDLDGRNSDDLPSPTINGDDVAFRDDDVTNHNTTICFLLGSSEYGIARDTVIERNRIHNCGELPATNHHHGVYVEVSDGARITDNWIYDNADRGVQLFPDAQNTYVARNVIDGNGQGVVFSRESANNVVEHNVISNPVVRYNLEDYQLTGDGNVARLNCVWSMRDPVNGGIQPDISVPLMENFVIAPDYANRDRKDFRLPPGTPCAASFVPPAPQSAGLPKPKRSVRLRTSTLAVQPGRRVRVRATIVSPSVGRIVSTLAVLKVRRAGKWRRVGVMRLRGNRYVANVLVGKREHDRSHRFGQTRITRGLRVLRLRAQVPGIGASNIVLVEMGA